MKITKRQLRKLVLETVLNEAERNKKAKHAVKKEFIKSTKEGGVKLDLGNSKAKKFFKNHDSIIIKPVNFDIDQSTGNIKGFDPSISYKFDVFDKDGTQLKNKVTFSGKGVKASPSIATKFLGGDLSFGVDVKLPGKEKFEKYGGKALFKGTKIAGVNFGFSKKF